jgi:hypothetical protein
MRADDRTGTAADPNAPMVPIALHVSWTSAIGEKQAVSGFAQQLTPTNSVRDRSKKGRRRD